MVKTDPTPTYISLRRVSVLSYLTLNNDLTLYPHLCYNEMKWVLILMWLVLLVLETGYGKLLEAYQ